MRLSSTDIYAFKALAHLSGLPEDAWARGDEIAAAGCECGCATPS